MFLTIYHEGIYRPLLNLLVFFYNVIPGHDIGVVIILLTILIRLVLSPLMHKQLKGQKAMNDLQPKLNELREKHKDDKEGQAKAMMSLYKEHNVNPLSSCLPLLIQLPLLIGLYQVFHKALGGSLDGIYPFISNPGSLNPMFLGLISMAKPSVVLSVLAGVLQFWQSRMMMKNTVMSTDTTAKAMSIQTMYVLPVFSIFIAWRLPAGLPLYWVVTTLFSIAQQYYIMKKPVNKGN